MKAIGPARASGHILGYVHVTVTLRVPGTQTVGYEGLFLVDSGAIDSMAPASKLVAAGIKPASGRSAEVGATLRWPVYGRPLRTDGPRPPGDHVLALREVQERRAPEWDP